MKHLLLLLSFLPLGLALSQDTLSVKSEVITDTTAVIEIPTEPDLQENQLSADTTAVIDEPAEPDPTQNQIIAHTTLGILPLESPEYSQIEMFTVADYVQKEAEAIGRFSTVTMLFEDVMLDTLKELVEGCADLDCAYDVADRAGVDQIIVIDLRKINKTGTDSTGATTLSGNMILYLISPETEEPEESGDEPKKTARDIPIMVKGWVSDISEKTRQILSGESRPADNRVNHWHRGTAIDVPDILRVMVWELLEEQAPEGHFTDGILALAQGGLVGQLATFITANSALAIGCGGLALVGGGYAIASTGSDKKKFEDPPKFPDVP